MYYNVNMENMEYILGVIIASAVGFVIAELCKLIIALVSKKNKRGKQDFKTIFSNLFRSGSIPFGCFTVLTITTLMAHEATYAGTSMYAGYNLASPKAIPFFVLLLIDIIVVISEIIGFVGDEKTRKNRVIGAIAGIVLGVIIVTLTLRIMTDLQCYMPWFGA